ncbi:unnamed protein product [Peronospora destructor]|uniref:Uncharacterized protein n=1 Tax=Peronospora destructor TaxID=86335 RepID=A0AAV0T7S9_9STRA|nr:unnamed protein product [Peronospora destructor]
MRRMVRRTQYDRVWEYTRVPPQPTPVYRCTGPLVRRLERLDDVGVPPAADVRSCTSAYANDIKVFCDSADANARDVATEEQTGPLLQCLPGPSDGCGNTHDPLRVYPKRGDVSRPAQSSSVGRGSKLRIKKTVE